jgi:tRNA (mo5U34)-methyltransferase
MTLPTPPGYGPEWNRLLRDTGWWHSFELPDGGIQHGVNSIEILKHRIAQFPIPSDLGGKRVLDIGAWDGWFSFEMERRGADVVALDCWDNPRFHEMHSVYNSRVRYVPMDVMEIAPESIGRFDIVLFMGVLYHLKHPLLALEKVCSVTTELTAVDSWVLRKEFDPDAQPVLEFYETNEMEGQTDNWVAPNLACLMAMCRTAGYARVEFRQVIDYGASVACYRHWEPANPEGPRVELLSVLHNTNFGINFDTRRDEYLTVGFQTEERDLILPDVQPAVGGYGVRPISVKEFGGGLWHANFKLPPGLPPGWHDVGMAIRGGPPHGAFRIAIDIPVPACTPRIEGVRDGTSWVAGRLDLSSGRTLALWCAGLPENADRNNVHVVLAGTRCPIEFVAPPGEIRQINVQVPERLDAGTAELVVRLGTSASAPAHLRLLRDRTILPAPSSAPRTEIS